MKRLIVLSAVATLLACGPDSHSQPIAAASAWTRRYEHDRLQARAAGSDCQILFIRTRAKLDDRSVEAIHYGTGPYTAYEGGAQQFAEDEAFRGVVYRDGAGAVWTYGAVSREEAESLPLCR